MRLGAVLSTIRYLLGVEPTDATLSAAPEITTSTDEERQQIEERLSEQQARLASLLASASLDEQRSRSQYHDA